jgi:hypothetical protein
LNHFLKPRYADCLINRNMAELTTNQALQLGVKHHRAGRGGDALENCLKSCR